MTDLIISGIIDGSLSGGLPKAIEFYALNDISDLSIYGFGSANNGGGTDGEEFTFSGSANAGDYIYVGTESTEFQNFLGFTPDFISGAASINGDDAIELFLNGSVVDVFGEIDVDGTGQPWEYQDGWAYRVPGTQASTTFNLADWTFSLPDALDGETSNNTAAIPFPLGTFSTSSTPNININEIRIDQPGSDNNEYFELAGTPGTSLDGLTYLVIGDDGNGSSGVIEAVISLEGNSIPSDGFFVAAESTFSLGTADLETTLNFENSDNVTHLLVSGFTGSNGDDLDPDDDGILYTTPWESIIDSVALIESAIEGEQVYSDTIVGSDGTFVPAHVFRLPNGTGDFQIGQFDPAASNDTPGDSNEENTGVGETVAIYDIQGAAQISPLLGENVTTTGIVTAVDSNGFYLQDPTGDSNDATSDAIFVFTSSAPGVAVGDELEVSGTVSEFTPGDISTRNLSTTQISGNPEITVISSGNSLPAAVIIGSGGRVPPSENIDDDSLSSFDPTTDGIDFFESLEGMRVTAQNLVAVAGTNRFGEIFAVVDNGADATGISQRGTLNISPDDFNPEKIQIDEDTGVFDLDFFPNVNAGDPLGDVTGVVSYNFGNFEIIPTENLTPINQLVGLEPESTDLVGNSGQLTIATYNVLNLDPNDSDGDSDLANGRFDEIAQQIVNNLATPDIIGLQEVQDNSGSVDDGTITADQTLQTLIDAIDRVDDGLVNGTLVYEFIDNTFIGNNISGGQPGGNIRTAILYNPNRVSLVDGSVQTIGSQASGEVFNGARLPLVASFEFAGEEVTVVNNHFSSKGGSAPIFGVEQNFADLQEEPNVNGSLDERREQAQAVNNFVDSVLANDPNTNLVVLGDLNEFEFISTLQILEGTIESSNGGQDTIAGGAAILTNLINNIPEDERYSFIFQGNSQELDHILVSDSLITDAEVDIVHTNVEFAETEERGSDHDPVITRLTITNEIIGTRFADNITGTAANDQIFALNGKDTIVGGEGSDTVFGGSAADLIIGGEGSDFLNGGRGRDILNGGNGADTITGGAGRDILNGGNGSDTLEGGNLQDIINGGNGNDILNGGRGRDILNGGNGADTLNGSRARDVLSGGSDSDTFVFKRPDIGERDLITDFTIGEDVIDVSQIVNRPIYGSSDPFTSYITLTQLGTDTVLRIDLDGDLDNISDSAIAVLAGINSNTLGADDFVF